MMRRLPVAAKLSLQALVFLWSMGGSSAADALMLFQSSLKVDSSAADAEGVGWDDQGSTIGDISPRMIDDDSPLVESANALLAQRRQSEERRALAAVAVTEAQLEVLSTTVTAALARVGASLDEHMLLTMQLKESLTGAKQGERGTPSGGRQDPATLLQLAGNGSRQARLAALEDSLDLVQNIFQGWSTVGAGLRSCVQSMESKLETLGERDFAAGMGARLDDALQNFDTASQTTFNELDESLNGISDESPDGGRADERIRQVQRSLKVFCRSANSFAHTFNLNMQMLADTMTARARQSNMREVEMQRVSMAFGGSQQAANAVAWKIYSDAWTLTTGILIAAADRTKAHDIGEAQVSEEAFAGEAASPEAVAPLKSAQAQTLSKAMVKLEDQVDELIDHTKEKMRRVVAAVNASASKLDRSAGESLVMHAIDVDVFPEWKQLGDQLRSISTLLTQCLENAGQAELAGRLYSLLDNNTLRSGGGLVHELSDSGRLASDLDAFTQRQDVLAHFFYRTFAEFLTGLRSSPGNGRMIDQRTLLLVQKADGSDRDKGDETEVGSEQSDDALGAAAVQEAAAIAWKIHSAAWVLVTDAHKATALLS